MRSHSKILSLSLLISIVIVAALVLIVTTTIISMISTVSAKVFRPLA